MKEFSLLRGPVYMLHGLALLNCLCLYCCLYDEATSVRLLCLYDK